jgi:A/G-specific adenine glycosylase
MHEIVKSLFQWYRQNARDLPWRNTADPYEIWVSEVVLQQTRVEQGMPYYEKIISNFPDFSALAHASEDDFLKIWQGLGYYSRARNMLKTAKAVFEDYQGVLPADYEKILALPGIGKYTAAAIASFAFELPHAAIDGNVRRVSARLFGIEDPIGTGIADKKTEENLLKLLPVNSAGLFNQSMIELGATVCVPRNPKCKQCPLNVFCAAFVQKRQDQLPVVQKKKKPVELKLDYVFLQQGDFTWLKKRDNSGIWKGLYEFPCVTGDSDVQILLNNLLADSSGIVLSGTKEFKHQLTHRTIFARFWHFCLPPSIIVHPNEYLRVEMAEVKKLPVHRLMHKYLEQQEIFSAI